MPTSKFHPIENLYRAQRSAVTAFLFFLVLGGLEAQEIPEAFQEKAETLVQLQPKTYEVLDQELYEEKKDTTLLRYFADLSAANDYPVGQSYALNQLGMKYRNFSQYEKSVNLHEQALEAAEEGNSTDFKILSLNMLGVVYRRTDRKSTRSELQSR